MQNDPKEKVIYLIRHAESVHNTLPVFPSPDNPLSPKGKRQARALAERFKNIEFDDLISSPWPRAKQTAEVIAKENNKKVVLSNLFTERIAPSILSGKPFTDKESNKIWQDWTATSHVPGIKKFDGESYDEVLTRAVNALKYLEGQNKSRLVVVTHGYFLVFLLSLVLLGEEHNPEILQNVMSHITSRNTGITVIRYFYRDNEGYAWRILTYNDHAHWLE